MLTLRQAIRELLLEQPLSALELSRRLGLPEKEILEHLAHLARAPGPGLEFVLEPSVCKLCGFVFAKRERLTTPSRCPRCRGQSLSRPRFWLRPRGSGGKPGQAS
ncbi:MAG: transcriptional regulator [Syntrophobacterales bacterium]|nr:transcriptional regulator [Syntrophobacterales bacterium]